MDEVLERYGVTAHARNRPDKVAIVAGARRITYGQLDQEASRFARVLRDRGVEPGRRLGVALRNRPEWLFAAYAAARLGAQVVPIPYGATADERAYFCEDGDVGFLLDEENLPEIAGSAAQQPADPIDGAGPDYVVQRSYTSGTTGRPKAVVRPEAPAWAQIQGMIRYFEVYGLDDADEVNLTASPLHHLAGFSGPHSALMLGHTCVLMEHFDAEQAVELIERERVTYWMCAPVHLYRLTRIAREKLAGADFSSVKRVLHGSAPCAPSLKRDVMALFPPGAVWETYGGTETMGSVITAEEWMRKPGSVGRPARGSTIKILDDEGNELPPGEVGLVYIGSEWGRGFKYSGPEELTESVYRGNLATLGDLGYLDDDGYLFVVDRRKDMVITGGANVYPAEVEAVLVRHPSIAEVAVIGVPDDEYGEIVTAIVVPDGELSADDVKAFAREHLVAYKSPRRVEIVAELPRDPMGKVQKRQLRDHYSTLGTKSAL
jgi:long-chain acyl-CoA synthetase